MLDISFNQILELENLQKLSHLSYLNLSRNYLKDHSIKIILQTYLPSLKYLKLAHNEISQLPLFKNDQGPIKLEILDISHNYIENLESLSYFKYLEKLNISNNKLKDASIKDNHKLKYIRYIDLSYNDLNILDCHMDAKC